MNGQWNDIKLDEIDINNTENKIDLPKIGYHKNNKVFRIRHDQNVVK